MKKLKLRQEVKDMVAIILFLALIFIGGFALSMRAEQIDNQNNIVEGR